MCTHRKEILKNHLDKWGVSLCSHHCRDWWSAPDLRPRVDARWRCCSTFWGESLKGSAAALWLGWKIRNNVSMTKWQIWTATAFCITAHRTDMWNAVGWLVCYTRGVVLSPPPDVFPPPWYLFWIFISSYLLSNIYTPGHHFVSTLTRAIRYCQDFNCSTNQRVRVHINS